jgi:beta-RFAP synthase
VFGVETDARTLARAVGRAKRSAIGTWTFDDGGLVVEGGRRADSDDCGPLIARVPIPSTWWCVVAIPEGAPGISGAGEAEAFARLPAPPQPDVERVAHIVLMALLPALADADLAGFGRALSEVQEITGRWFASVQGGTYAPGPSGELLRRMAEWGASGVGQSSWGPAVYGIVEGDEAGRRLADRVCALGLAGTVFVAPFRSDGARVWRMPVHAAGLLR